MDFILSFIRNSVPYEVLILLFFVAVIALFLFTKREVIVNIGTKKKLRSSIWHIEKMINENHQMLQKITQILSESIAAYDERNLVIDLPFREKVMAECENITEIIRQYREEQKSNNFITADVIGQLENEISLRLKELVEETRNVDNELLKFAKSLLDYVVSTPKGEKGDPGERGPKGDKGDKGDRK